MKNLKSFFTLGDLSALYVIHKMFYLGIVFIAYKTYQFGEYIYSNKLLYKA